jgi:hypothetical protein
MQILVVVFSWLLFGGTSSYFASTRGRDPFAWFLIGMLIGILGLLLLFLLPPITVVEKDLVEESAAQDSFQSAFRFREWFYLDEKQQQKGPLAFSLLRKRWESGNLSTHTLVWSEGMGNWKKIDELPELKEALQ